jgi:hypothetical protein
MQTSFSMWDLSHPGTASVASTKVAEKGCDREDRPITGKRSTCDYYSWSDFDDARGIAFDLVAR